MPGAAAWLYGALRASRSFLAAAAGRATATECCGAWSSNRAVDPFRLRRERSPCSDGKRVFNLAGGDVGEALRPPRIASPSDERLAVSVIPGGEGLKHIEASRAPFSIGVPEVQEKPHHPALPVAGASGCGPVVEERGVPWINARPMSKDRKALSNGDEPRLRGNFAARGVRWVVC